ncbi:MAG: hypothetical protein MZU97_06005 [Bacillus subtilis]|nr:hypothetical protein [Bacillus subtilis]
MNDLATIFQTLKTILIPYAGPLTITVDTVERFDLVSKHKVVIDGRKRDEVFFASLIIQSDYVGFYYMPVYADPEQKQVFHEDLLRLLKGKSCFHIRRLDAALKEHIASAIAHGIPSLS